MTRLNFNLSSYVLFIMIFLTSCSHNRIETNETLSKKDKEYIRSLNLLDNNEKIDKFYSEYKNEVAGNFFTDKRLAKYWTDERDKSKDKIVFAYYKDIKSIDTVYNADITYCPYMLVTKNDGTKLKFALTEVKKKLKTFLKMLLINGHRIKMQSDFYSSQQKGLAKNWRDGTQHQHLFGYCTAVISVTL